MKIEKVNLRVVKEGASREVFVTCVEPYLNFVIHTDQEVESGQGTLEWTPNAKESSVIS